MEKIIEVSKLIENFSKVIKSKNLLRKKTKNCIKKYNLYIEVRLLQKIIKILKKENGII